VTTALRAGFRGIDTACQPKHYHEPGVGSALQALFALKELRREDVFIQTKFTSLDGQDPARIPYDPKATLEDQVKQSMETSLKNLQVSYIDSLVMHSPMRTFKDTLSVWRVFESFVDEGKVRQLGMSNCYDLETLSRLWEEARVKPAVIQNRLYKETNFDQGIRAFARKNGIYYQSFWTLTANPKILSLPAVRGMAEKYGKTPAQIFFAYLINSAGLTPLTGTTNETHMTQDLEAMDLHLTDEEAAVFDSIINSDRLS
jgi:diketogulonate reductase-like aldo/keto reductase